MRLHGCVLYCSVNLFIASKIEITTECHVFIAETYFWSGRIIQLGTFVNFFLSKYRKLDSASGGPNSVPLNVNNIISKYDNEHLVYVLQNLFKIE